MSPALLVSTSAQNGAIKNWLIIGNGLGLYGLYEFANEITPFELTYKIRKKQKS